MKGTVCERVSGEMPSRAVVLVRALAAVRRTASQSRQSEGSSVLSAEHPQSAHFHQQTDAAQTPDLPWTKGYLSKPKAALAFCNVLEQPELKCCLN